jgi:type IV secretion system protein VirB10
MQDENGKNPAKTKEGLPEVAQDKQKSTRVFIIIGALIFIGLILHFLSKSTHKESNNAVEETYTVKGGLAAPQNPSQNTVSIAQTAPTATGLTDEQKKLLLAKRQQLQQRVSAPMMVVNSGGQKSDTSNAKAAMSSDPNTQFMNQVSARTPDMVNATQMGDLSYIIAEGGLIHAVLETAINSDLPGYLRATVSMPVYSEDGSRVLVPVGSRLIGQYKSGMLYGQSRVFAVWTRLITPDGVSVQLGSPGVDNLGMAGFNADAINRHFWQSFGTSILLSIIGAGVDNIGVSSGDQYNAAQAYRVAVADSLSQTANQSLKQTGIIPPTLTVNQGKPIMVFVAHDLNFAGVMKQLAKNRLNVF